MELPQATDLLREMLMICLLVAGPTLAVGVLVGLVISLLQAVTQLQDQTISMVPKIVAMLIAALFLVPWAGTRLIEYTQQMLASP